MVDREKKIKETSKCNVRKSPSLLSFPVRTYFCYLIFFFFRCLICFLLHQDLLSHFPQKKNKKISSSFLPSPLLSCLLKSLLSSVSFLLSSPSFRLLPVVLSESILLHPALPLSHHLSPHSPIWSLLKFHPLCSFLLSAKVLSSLSSPALSPSPLLSSPLLSSCMWWIAWVSVQPLTVIASVTVRSLWLLALSIFSSQALSAVFSGHWLKSAEETGEELFAFAFLLSWSNRWPKTDGGCSQWLWSWPLRFLKLLILQSHENETIKAVLSQSVNMIVAKYYWM